MDSMLVDLPDEKVLELTHLELPPEEDQRLSDLLYKQQAGQLEPKAREELSQLMQLYQEGLLCKAQALSEAVKRGLREPLG